MKNFNAQIRFVLTICLMFCLFISTQSIYAQDQLVAKKTTEPITIDGFGTEAAWSTATWYQIDQLWLGTTPTAQDFTGRYKLIWDQNYLYVLTEITDDILSDDHVDPLTNWWDDDCIELFIDENYSKGNHQYNYNAFAYHVSLTYDVVDIGIDKNPHLFNDHITTMRTKNGNTYTWECKVKIFGESFVYGGTNTPLALTDGKKMGFSVAYNDNDAGTARENFMGSGVVPGADKNVGYITADYFQQLTLTSGQTGILTKITVDPTNGNIGKGESIKINATGWDQNNVQMGITPMWSTTGGIISQSGLFTGTISGTFVVTAASGAISASSIITVNDIPYLTIPGRIEAEAFCASYGIQTQPTTDESGVSNIGYTDPGDWMDYCVDVKYTDLYTIDFRVASILNTGAVELRNSAGTKLSSIALNPGTGGWQNWVTKRGTTSFNLPAGKQTIRIFFTGAGLNINWFEIKSDRKLTTIEVTPATANIADGSLQQYIAIGKDQFGTVMPITPTWTVTGGGTINQAGVYSATTPGGPYTVKATVGTVSGNAQVSVYRYPMLTSITVTPATTTLYVGQTQQYTAVGRDQYGDDFPITPRWTATGGGTIDQAGIYSATTAGGPFSITASAPSNIDDSEIDGIAQVTVKPIPVLTRIVILPLNPVVQPNGSIQLNVIGYDQYENIFPIPPAIPILWSVTGGGVINANGLFMASTVGGSAKVCAMVLGISACTTITIEQLPVLTTIEVIITPSTVFVGEQFTSLAKGKDQFGHPIDFKQPVEWSITSPVIIIFSGTYYPSEPGIYNVCAKSGNVIGCATLVVKEAPRIKTIQVTPAIVTMKVGETQQFKAVAIDQYGNEMPFTPQWQVAAGGGGTISQTGLFTATAPSGPFSISAIYLGGGYYIVSGYAEVTVDPAPKIIHIEAESYTDQKGIQTEPTKDPSGGGLNVGWVDNGDWMTYSINIPAAGNYTANFRVAGWTATGKIELQNAANTKLTGIDVPNIGGYQVWNTVAGANTFSLAAGTQTIRIYASGAPWNLNWFELKIVEPSVLKKLVLSPENVTIVQDEQVCFKLTGYDQYGKAMPDVIFPDSWITPCGTLSAYGCFFGSQPGTCTFTAIKGAISATATVITLPKPILTTITVTPPMSSLFPGQTQQYTAVGKDQYGNVMAITPAPLWTATGGSINSATGLYTAGTVVGSYNVIAQSGSIVSPAASVTIIDVPVVTKIEAETYTAQNGFQVVDITGGKALGYADAGDWADYNITVAQAGTYNVTLRVSSGMATGAFQLKNGANVSPIVKVANGGWANYVEINTTITLAQGAQTIRLLATGTGFNTDWLQISLAKSAEEFAAGTSDFFAYPNPATNMVTIETLSSDFSFVKIYSIAGKLMLNEPISSPVTELNISGLKKGLYLIKLEGLSISETQKLIVE
jgi:hypothetical protein